MTAGPAAPVPRSRFAVWRRRLFRAAALLALLLLVPLACALLLLHLSVGRTAVKGFVETAVGQAVEGRLSLGALDYNLFTGRIDVAGARLEAEGFTLTLERVEVRYEPRQGLRVRFFRPTIVVRDSGRARPKQAAAGIGARPWSALERLAHAEVVEGRLELQDTAGRPYLAIGRLDATLEARDRHRPIRITVSDGTLGASGGAFRLGPVAGEALLDAAGGTLAIESLRLTTDGSRVEARGSLARLSPIEATATLRASVDAALVSAGSPAAGLSGRIEGDANVQATARGMTGTIRLSAASGLTVRGSGPWGASARAHFDARELVLDLVEATGYSGRITAEGPIAIDGESKTDVRLRVEGIDVRALARSWSDVPLRSRLDAALRYVTRGLDLAGGRGTGELALRPPADAPHAAGEVRGLPLAGRARLSVDGRRLRLSELSVEAHDARLTGELGLSAAGAIDGRIELGLPLPSVAEFAADLGLAAPPQGLDGRLRVAGELGGRLRQPTLAFRLHGEGLGLASARDAGRASIEAEARYGGGRLSLEPLTLRSGAGQAVFTGTLPVLPTAGDWAVAGEAHGLELGPLLAAAGIAGRGLLDGNVRIEGPREQPLAHADLDAGLSLAAARPGPITLSLSATGSRARVSVERFSAVLAGGRVQGSGWYDTATRALEARADAADLRIAQLPLLPAFAHGFDGALVADLALRGTVEAPVGEVHANVAGATLDGKSLPAFALAARADGSRLELTGTYPAGAAGEAPSVFLRGTGPLRGDWPMRIEVAAAALPVQALLDALPATKGWGLTAEAQGTLVVETALRDPRQLRYSADGLAAHGRLRELEWRTDPFHVEGDAQEARLAGLLLSTRASAALAGRGDTARTGGDSTAPATGASTLALDGRIPIAPGRTFDLSARGELDLASLQAVVAEDRASGKASLQLRVRGTLETPELDGRFALADARGRFGGARLSQVQVAGRFQGQEALLDECEARVLGGRVFASGSLPLARLADARSARLHFEAQDLDLSRLALDGPARTPESPTFLASFVGDVVATAPALDAVRAEGRVTRLDSTSPEGTIGLAGAAAWRLAEGRFVLDPLRLAGPLGTLEASVEARLAGEPSGSAALSGPLDLRFVSPFVPDTTLAGPAHVDVHATWDASGTRVLGEISVENARLTLEQLAFTASQLSGRIRFLGDRATIEATAAAGDGQLVASGGMRFGPKLLGPAELRIEARRVPVGYPEGFRGRASGTIRVAGDVGRYDVTGEVDLSQSYYSAEFDARRQSLDRLDYQLAALRDGSSLADSLPLALTVRFVDPLRIRNSRAQLDVAGTLTVGGTLAQPVTTGQVSLLEGGTLTVRRARIRPQDGRIELNGYPAGVPEVDFSGLTQVGGVTMNVQAQGTLEDLQLEISSPNRPDLSQADLVSLLLTGRTAQGAASESGAIVAEELASALGGVLQKGVGETFLIDVSSDRSLLLDEADPTQRFNVGTRLGQTLSVVYSTRLDGTEQRWVMEWNPRGGRLRLRAIDDRTQGLAVEISDRLRFDIFHHQSPARASAVEQQRLSALRFDGTLPLPESELRRAAGLKVGHRYDPLRLAQAADRVRAQLVAKGWRGAAVDAVTQSQDGEKQVALALRVEAGPGVQLVWTGDDPGEKVRREATKAWPPYASPEAAASSVGRAARVALQSRGFYGATVGHAVQLSSGRAEVRLDVASGPKGRSLEVDFSGNEALSDARLAATLPKPGSHAFFEELDRGSRLTAEARIAYASAGYLRARLGPARTRFDPASGRLTVSIPVRERGASRVGAITLPEQLGGAGSGSPALRLKTGAPFDLEAYLEDRDAIAAWFRREGWMDARVRGVLDPRGDEVAVSFVAEAGARRRRGEVRVASAGRVRESIVRRAVELAPGEVIRPRQLSDTRARLSETNLFSTVDVRPVPVEGSDDVADLVVSYVERPDVELEYGLRYGASNASTPGGAPSSPSQGSFQVAAALELTNPFGIGWRLRAFTQQTRDRHNYTIGLESGTLFGLRVRTLLVAFDQTQDQSLIAASFASNVRGFSLQQSRTLLRDTGARRHDRLRLQWGYTNKDIQYSESVGSPVLVAGNRAFLSLSLIGDERDSLTDPRKGVFWTATTELARRFLGSDVDYVRLYGQLFGYLPLPGGLVWAQGYRAGVVPGDDPFFLLENRFQAGGPTTVRGFRQNGLGPQFDAEEGFGGQGVFVANQEIRFPIWAQLKGGVFWDAGNAWLLANEFSLRDLRHSVGAGLRVMLPFGPVRIEYAFILNRRETEPRGRFVFGLGHAF